MQIHTSLKTALSATEANEDLPYLRQNNMIMGSDYGHRGQSREEGMMAAMRRQKNLSPAVVNKILWDNPRNFYGLSGRTLFPPSRSPD